MPADPSLSERELEILRQVATGASNKEIAQLLGISPNTVKVHLRNIFAKIGAATRTSATLYALEHGLMAPPAPQPVAQISTPQPVEQPAAAIPPPLNRRWLVWAGLGALLVLTMAALIFAGRLLSALTASTPAPPVAAPAAFASIDRWNTQPPLPQARSGMAAAVYEGSIYLVGGWPADGEEPRGATAETLRYRPDLGAWETRAPRPIDAGGAPAAVLGEKIYVPGGQTRSGQPCANLDIYDPRLDQWETGAPLPMPLTGPALAAFEGRLYLFGGWDGKQARDEVYAYDPQQDEWSLLARLPEPRAFAAAVALEGKALVIGGERAGLALDSTLAFYPQRTGGNESPWEQRAALPAARTHAAAASLAGVVYLAGGNSVDAPALLQYQPQEDTWLALGPGPAIGADPALVPLETRLHAIDSRGHWSYQAIYTLLVPLQ